MACTEGREAYVELNAGILPAHVETRMLQQLERGDEVCSIYELELQTPSGARITVPMAQQRIYYSAREFEKAFTPPG